MIRPLAIVAVAAVLAASPATAQEPMTDAEAIAALGSDEAAERYMALWHADREGWRTSPEFKALLLERAWQVMRSEIRLHDEHEGVFTWLNAVIRTHNPDAIPLLIEHGITRGGIPANAVADFGATALPLLLDHIRPREDEDPTKVTAGLWTLRFMIEDGLVTPEVVETVRSRLTEAPQDWNVVRYAMMAAVATGDPGLLRRVKELASEPEQIVALVGDRQIVAYAGPRPLVARMMEDAGTFLAGDLMSGSRRPCWTGDCPGRSR